VRQAHAELLQLKKYAATLNASGDAGGELDYVSRQVP
jgi:hypothetical protein